MNFKRLMNLKNINIWLIGSTLGLNLVYTAVLLFLSLAFLGTSEGITIMMLACFLGPFIIGWVITMMAGDGRGPTYGVYGAIVSAGLVAFASFSSAGIMALLLVIVTLAGGFNGGVFGEYLRHRNG